MIKASVLIICLFLGLGNALSIKNCPRQLPRNSYLQYYNGMCYRFALNYARGFWDANEDCKKTGGSLVVIKNRHLNEYIWKQLYYGYRVLDDTWIGLSDVVDEGEFIWADGTNADNYWTNWGFHEGTSSHLSFWQEDCAAINPRGGEWKDHSCEDKFSLFKQTRLPYICQYRPVRQRTTIAPTTNVPSTMAPSTKAPSTMAPSTRSPSTMAPSTMAPSTMAPSTMAPSTMAPSTIARSTMAPSTMAPSTMAPSTMVPSTKAPSTMAPSTMAPSTMAPSTMAPSTMAPSTMAPSTMAPSTMAPSTMAPSTMAQSTMAPSTMTPSTMAPSTMAPSTMTPSTMAPSTMAPSTMAPVTES